MSYLSIVQRSCALLTLPQPTTVVDSTDRNVQQIGALASEVGEELARLHDWQALTREYTFSTLAQEDQTGAVPADWDRFIANSFYNRSTRREVMGPITPQQWQAIKAYPQINSVFLAYRERDGAFLITPVPPADNTIAYEYVSANWVIHPDESEGTEFTEDADTTYLDERLIRLGIVYRFKQAKGLDYGKDEDIYRREVQKLSGKDGGSGKINISGHTTWNWAANIPSGNWPGP